MLASKQTTSCINTREKVAIIQNMETQSTKPCSWQSGGETGPPGLGACPPHPARVLIHGVGKTSPHLTAWSGAGEVVRAAWSAQCPTRGAAAGTLSQQGAP